MNALSSYLTHTKTAHAWSRVGIRSHHGICVPLFSLKTHNSAGVGDFSDLRLLVDWCQSIGFDTIQLLPINDTGDDPSPYNALSSCALDPLYIDLKELSIDCVPFVPFNPLQRLPHAEIKHLKIGLLRQYFSSVFASIKNRSDYQSFIRENPWLHSYALFKACKDEYGGKHWEDWPEEKQSLKSCQADQNAVDFHCFLQFIAFRQMQEAKRYAEQKNIFLKGDIPILLSPDSADVWAEPSLFNMQYSAGAPPDYYNQLGQKWGFPLFNWDAMRRQNFAWWQQRLKVAEKLFHIYRIDHVVGFFRIWAIRGQDEPANGHYVPEDPALWGRQGREILEMMIESSHLLPMAEDLGSSIPEVVYETLKHLGICGTKVMRWVKHDGQIVPFSDYDPISLTTVSTPDSETLALWWKNLPQEASNWAAFKHWKYEPHLAPWQQKELLYDAHHTPSLFHINLLQEYLSLNPSLISANPEDERINIPGTLLPTNWTYRMKPTIEELLSDESLRKEIQDIIR